MMEEERTLYSRNQQTTVCIHCSTQLSNDNEDENIPSLFKVEVSMSTSGSKALLSNALSTIFKLNYLKAFDTLDAFEELKLCLHCSDVLNDLHQMYNSFLRIGEINSYLSRKLSRLDEIIECHQQRSINCDLIVRLNEGTIRDGDVNTCEDLLHENSRQEDYDSFCEPLSNLNVIKNDSIVTEINASESNKISTVNFKLEPRIVLTRLAIKPSQFESVSKFYNEQSHYDDDDIINDYPSSDSDGNMNQSSEAKYVSLKMEDYEEFRSVDSNLESSKRVKNHKSKTVSKRLSTRKVKKSVTKSNHSISTSSRKRSSTSSRSKSEKSKKKKKTAKESSFKSKSGLNIVRETGKNSSKQPKNKNYLCRRTKCCNPCWYCRQDFPTPAECVEHTRNDHLPKGYDSAHVCDRCSKICFNDNSFALHMKRCELIPSGVLLPKLFQCAQCPKSFGSKKGLQSHTLHHSTDRPFACDECKYHGKTALALNLHKTNKHSVEIKEQQSKIKCDQCDSFVKNETLLKMHKINMHTVEGYKKYRERQETLLASLREKRKLQSAQSSTVCSDCGVDMYSRLAFINHRKSFHGDHMGYEYVCEKCGRDFMKPAALKLHMDRVHSDARPYLCQKCGKGFKAAHNLRNHDEHTHSTEGRLKYNEKMRERNRRRKLLESQLAQRKVQSPTQMFIENIVDGNMMEHI